MAQGASPGRWEKSAHAWLFSDKVTCAEKDWAERGGLWQLGLAMGSFARPALVAALLFIRWRRALLQLLARAAAALQATVSADPLTHVAANGSNIQMRSGGFSGTGRLTP